MKATGVVRNIDNSGRLVIPKELRKKFGVECGMEIEYYMRDGGELVLKVVKEEEN